MRQKSLPDREAIQRCDVGRAFYETDNREFPLLDSFDLQPASVHADWFGAVLLFEAMPPNLAWRHAETSPAVICGMFAELHRHLDIVRTDQDSQPVVVPVVANTDRFRLS